MKLKKYKSQKSNDIAGKLKSYSALTGAFLLTAGASQGQIIYTDLNPDGYAKSSTYDIDMDNDGVKDFGFLHYTYYGTFNHSCLFMPGANPGNRVMGVFTRFNINAQTFTYILNLPSGNPIGPGGPFFNFRYGMVRLCRRNKQILNTLGGNQYVNIYKNGFWIDSTGYIGVEFKTNGNKYYGWIEVAVDSMADSILVKSYAYESTPNKYIIAGAGKTTGVSEKQLTVDPASSFYPNPVSHGKTFIHIEAKQPADLKIEIINGMGQILQTEDRRLNSAKNVVELDVNSFSNGTYFVKLIEGENVFFRKILLNK